MDGFVRNKCRMSADKADMLVADNLPSSVLLRKENVSSLSRPLWSKYSSTCLAAVVIISLLM